MSRFGLGFTASATSGNIIGVAVTNGAATHTRIDKDGVTLSGAQYSMGGAYYSTHGAFALAAETIDGQAMIKVPAMWYRRATIASGTHSGKEAWWVADFAAPGFTRHPAFKKDGANIPHFWLGKYQGTDDGGTKLGSVAGVLPLVSLTISQFESRAAARNVAGQTGFMQWSMYQLAVVQMLAMIEAASTDSQASIGMGRVSAGDAANVDASDVAQATYRGVVGLWGNVYQKISGMDYASSVVRLWDRLGNKTWVSTGISTKPANNFQVTMNASAGATHDFKDVFFPLTTTATEASSTFRDAGYFDYTGDKVTAVGGFWGFGPSAGLWFVYCGAGASGADTDAGSRLAKEP